MSNHDFCHLTLTYNLNLANVMVNLHTEYQGRRPNGSAVRVHMDEQTDATKYIVSLHRSW